jgi:hypothetical protein
MPTLTVNAPIVANNAGTVSFQAAVVGGGGSITGPPDNGFLYVGTAFKGNVEQCSWLMFEPNIPAGATLTRVEVGIYLAFKSGSLTVPIIAGFLALDGTWNNQSGNNGWRAYPSLNSSFPLPPRNTATNAKWQDGTAPFFIDFLTTDPPPSGPPAMVTYASSGGIKNAAAMLTQAQNQLVANEANRNVRGVPMAFFYAPRDPTNTELQHRGSVQSNTAQRPYLTIDYVTGPPRARFFDLLRPQIAWDLKRPATAADLARPVDAANLSRPATEAELKRPEAAADLKRPPTSGTLTTE